MEFHFLNRRNEIFRFPLFITHAQSARVNTNTRNTYIQEREKEDSFIRHQDISFLACKRVRFLTFQIRREFFSLDRPLPGVL